MTASTITRVLKVLSWLLRILLAAFFAFVGYWKALGPIEALAEHHAWVAGFPDWFARVVGWSEIACAAGLIIPLKDDLRRVVVWAAVALFINQVVAMMVHFWRGEGAEAAPQNLVLMALLSIVIAVSFTPGASTEP